MKHLNVICDLQFGSCGKGLLAGYLAKNLEIDTLVTAWAPNAGHTFIDKDGNKWVHTMLANGVVAESVQRVLIGPGSVINPEALMMEMERIPRIQNGEISIWIHENAAVVNEMHRSIEAATMVGIGSTMKGVGAALTDKIKRQPDHPIIARDVLKGTPLEGCVIPVEEYNIILDDVAQNVLLEGAQGFSLSINQGFYPYTTSRDCTVNQLMSDCAIPRGGEFSIEVYGAARTFPIRVANRYDAEGKMVGWSGPGYYDQEEIKWEDIGIQPELTTVTKLPRRIFTFSMEQIQQAVRMNGVDYIFLNFANYLDPSVLAYLVDQIQKYTDVKVKYVGFGPKESDIMEISK